MADELCDHHREVVANLAHLDHVDDRDSTRVALELIRQCCGKDKP